MAPDLVQIRALAKEKEDENWRFRRFVKSECDLDPAGMDRQVFETTRRVWAHIDCTACANCCREVRPTFSEEEVSRLAIRLECRSNSSSMIIYSRSKTKQTHGKRAPLPARF
jgi:hypothetical protein